LCSIPTNMEQGEGADFTPWIVPLAALELIPRVSRIACRDAIQ